MRSLIAPLAVAAAALAFAPKADAQVLFVDRPLPSTPVYVGDGYTAAVIPPYSYYAAYPSAARIYVPYGNEDFVYQGRAYGSPSDPWTWPYMRGPYYGGALARYYYEPLR